MATLQRQQQQAEQWRRMQRLAMMKENLQKTNQWAQQGNTGALLGDIAGSWLQGYLGKLLEKIFIQPRGKVNEENVKSGITDALNQKLGGTPEELLREATDYNTPPPSYDFPNANLENLPTAWEQRRAEIEKNNPYGIDTSFGISPAQQVSGKTLNSRYLTDNVPVNLQEWADSKFPIKGNFSFVADTNPLPKGQYNPKVTAPSKEEQFLNWSDPRLREKIKNLNYSQLSQLYPNIFPNFGGY